MEERSMHIGIIVSDTKLFPTYAYPSDAGFDLRADINDEMVIYPRERAVVFTGVKLQIPKGWEVQIRPRSGLAYKHGVTVLNAPGTIDSGYDGFLGVILINHSNENYVIKRYDKIAQGVLARVEQAEFCISDYKFDSERSDKGFGSTGVQ
jgi:dUTP pyrophosphatase